MYLFLAGLLCLDAAHAGQLSSADEKRLQAKLNDPVKMEVRKLQSGSTKENPYPKSWLLSDAGLLRGEASLSTAVHSIQAGEEIRYFVKAQWAIKGKAVFLATAWVKPEGFAVQSFDSRAAQAMRTPEFDRVPNVDDLDKVLNAFDDGVLIFAQEFESFSIVLYRSVPSGLVKTAVEFAQGV